MILPSHRRVRGSSRIFSFLRGASSPGGKWWCHCMRPRLCGRGPRPTATQLLPAWCGRGAESKSIRLAEEGEGAGPAAALIQAALPGSSATERPDILAYPPGSEGLGTLSAALLTRGEYAPRKPQGCDHRWCWTICSDGATGCRRCPAGLSMPGGWNACSPSPV